MSDEIEAFLSSIDMNAYNKQLNAHYDSLGIVPNSIPKFVDESDEEKDYVTRFLDEEPDYKPVLKELEK